MSRTLTKSRKGETQRAYTPEDIERGLQLTATLGNAAAAAEELGFPPETVRYWCRKTHRDRYLAIREELAPKIHAQIAAETEDLALELADGVREALVRTRQEIPNLPGKDAAAATKNLTFALNNAVDKSLLIRRKPTSIVEHRDIDVVLRQLEQRHVIEGTATEITDAEEVASP